jgi:NADH-quinone oxidoreductase subunit J
MDLATICLYIFSGLAVAGGVGLVAFRHPVRSAISLLLTMLSLAGIYALLDAHLMAAFQVLIYAGAIIVLIVYVIMLLDIQSDDARSFRGRDLVLSIVAVVIMTTLIGGGLAALPFEHPPMVEPSFGTVASVGGQLLGPYVLAFEISGALLLAGIVAAVYLTTKEGAER